MGRLLGGMVLAAFLTAASVGAEAPSLEQELQDILETFLAENEMAPGLSACVICPSLDLDWAGAAGTVAKGDTAVLTAAHTFRIASNTKTYVAAALLRLVEQGRLGLDDRLGEHLTPEQAKLLSSDGYDLNGITVAHVLSHTAGLGDHSDDPRYEMRIMADPQYPWTPAEQTRLLVEWQDPAGGPGEKYDYSDTGYIILGTIIERLTGRPLGPSVRDLLGFNGLGLNATYWEYMEDPPASAGPRAHQYYGMLDVTSWYASYDLYGGGGLVSDTRDLTLFLRRLLNGEVFAHESTLAAMTTRGTLRYRLGLMAKECRGRVVLGHQGFWNTFVFHESALDLTIGGSILDHDAANGFELMCRLMGAVLAAAER